MIPKKVLRLIFAIMSFSLGAGCVTDTVLKGGSDVLEWEITDLYTTKRNFDGRPHYHYAFTVILKERKGKLITLNELDAQYHEPNSHFNSHGKRSVDLKLKPYSKTRLPFGFSYSGGAETFFNFAPIFSAKLSGTDVSGNKIQVIIKTRLPSNPNVRFNKTADTEPLPNLSTAEKLKAETSVPVQIAGNAILVHASLNQKERVTLLFDTGAAKTLINPDVAKLLGITPGKNAPERYLSLIGGKTYKAAIITLREVKVGDAVVRNLQVGVAQVFPDISLIDGILGSDFLEHFKFTLDRQKSELSLSPFSETNKISKEKE